MNLPFHCTHILALQVRYAHDGSLYASCCKGGLVKLWDGVSNRCVATFPSAHSRQPVSSVRVREGE